MSTNYINTGTQQLVASGKRTYNGSTKTVGATLDLYVDEDTQTLNWKLTISTYNDEVKPWLYLYLDLGIGSDANRYPFEQTGTYYVWDGDYSYGHGDKYNTDYNGVPRYQWNSSHFPRKQDSYQEGTIQLTSTTPKSFTIQLAVEPGHCTTPANFSTGTNGIELYTTTFNLVTRVGKGSASITDHGNNTFTIEATVGNAGTNNPVLEEIPAGTTRLEVYNSSNTKLYSKNFGSNTTVDITSGELKNLAGYATTNDVYSIYAKVFTYGTYNSTIFTSETVNIKNYVNPKIAPDTSTLNYIKNRLTLKEPWTLTWSAATQGNNSSPVAGYRVYFYKKSPNTSRTTIPIVDIAGTTLSSVSNNVYFYDTESTACSLTIDPVKTGLAVKDVVDFKIKAYSKNGKNVKMFTNDFSESSTYTVENAGIVDIKIGNTFKEGQVWIKTKSNGWKEAETVSIKTVSGWEESQ